MYEDSTNKLSKMNISGIKEWINKLKRHARQLKQNTYLLYLAYKHPGTPWYAKAMAAVVIAYALSPIDLIPDFIPILGYLDDLLLIPAGITLSLKLIPKNVIEDCRQNLDEQRNISKRGVYGTIFIVVIWIVIIYTVAIRFIK